jgi:predicted transcriptional regulator of viral defense system
MPRTALTDQARAIAFLKKHPIARQSELAKAGVHSATLTRMMNAGVLLRVGYALYQLAQTSPEQHHDLAVVCKLAPNGVICLTSALGFHELTDHLPPKVWLATQVDAPRPRFAYPPVRVVRFSGEHYSAQVERHRIEGVTVKVYSVTKTVVDLFRCERMVGRNIALEGLRNSLRDRKTTPGKIGDYALKVRAWSRIEPYLAAYTADA